MLQIFVTAILAIILYPLSINCNTELSFQFLSRYKDYIYAVHPLIFIAEHGKKTLVKQNQLDKNGVLTLSNTQQVLLICPGYNNVIAADKSERVIDITKDKLEASWIRYFAFPIAEFDKNKIEEARCISPMLAHFKTNNNQPCGAGTGVYADVEFKYKFQVMESECVYAVCFDWNQNISPIYTVHQLLGSELLFPEDEALSAFPITLGSKLLIQFFSSYPGKNYMGKRQEAVFRRTFDPIKANWYLKFKDAEGQLYVAAPLTPPGDFYYKAVKTATYLLENTVPIFSTIYHGNLHIIQVLGRILALQSKSKKLAVISGTFGILELPNSEGVLKPIYLHERVIGVNLKQYRPIPKYLYKIFYDLETKSGIAFVILNNPFFESTNDFPCKNIKQKFSPRIDFFGSVPRLGITACCSVEDLMATVKGIPKMDVTGHILSVNTSEKSFPWNQLKPRK